MFLSFSKFSRSTDVLSQTACHTCCDKRAKYIKYGILCPIFFSFFSPTTWRTARNRKRTICVTRTGRWNTYTKARRITRRPRVSSINHTRENLSADGPIHGAQRQLLGNRNTSVNPSTTSDIRERTRSPEGSLIDAWTSHLSRKFGRSARASSLADRAFRRDWKCHCDKYSAFGLGQPSQVGETGCLTFASRQTLEYYYARTCGTYVRA